MQDIALGRYRLLEHVGAGGMADVWLATDETSGTSVAVKRLRPQLAADPAMVARFAREAEAAAAIRHPNVVRALDAGPSDIVLEYVAGASLAERLRDGPLDADVAVRVAADLASALAAVHAAGFVHGDVTPGNVIVDKEGIAHLTDFGVATPILPAGTVAPRGTLMGTRPYVAPEVIVGWPASPASDVWSLGALLREALTVGTANRSTSAGKSVTAPQRVTAAIELGALAPLLPQMLDAEPARRPSAIVVARTLAPSPEAVTEVLGTTPPVAGATWAGDTLGVALLQPTRSPRRRMIAPGRKVGVALAGFLMAAGLALAAAGPAEPAAGSQAQTGVTAPPPLATATPSPRPASTKPAAPQPRVQARGRGHWAAGNHGHGHAGGQGGGGGGQGGD